MTHRDCPQRTPNPQLTFSDGLVREYPLVRRVSRSSGTTTGALFIAAAPTQRAERAHLTGGRVPFDQGRVVMSRTARLAVCFSNDCARVIAATLARAVLLGLLVACRYLPSAALPAPCPAPAVDTGGWTRVNGYQFSFSLPPGLKRTEIRGIDSVVEGWASDRGSVRWTTGPRTDPLENVKHDPNLTSYSECTESIGGKAAKVVVFQVGEELGAGAYWSDVGDGRTLTFVTSASTAARLNELLALLRTVRFDP